MSSSRPGLLHKLVMSTTILGALVTLLVTAVTLLASWWWPADLLTNFRVQISMALLPMLVVLALCRRWRWLGMTLLLLLINGAAIAPYFLPSEDSKAGRPDLTARSYRLMTLNVLSSNTRINAVLELVREEQPDFLVLMEINQRWVDGLVPLTTLLPHAKFESREHNFGIAVLSKHPWAVLDIQEYGDASLPWIDARFDLQGVVLGLVGVHALPPMSESSSRTRNTQLLAVSARASSTPASIVTGDFNMTPWSPWFGKTKEAGGLRDAALGFGISRTWQVFPGLIGGLKIDHALVSDQITIEDFRVGRDVGSDHRAIVVDFSILPGSP